MQDSTGLLDLFGMASIALAMIVLALLSKRLGAVTHTPRFYRGFYISAALMMAAVSARLLNWLQNTDPALINSDPVSILLYVGLPVLAITLAVIVAWRYWSWLLAERG
jgi:chromate transport protein ChrA